jgi:hypothetical protein
MNAILQSLNAVQPLVKFFLDAGRVERSLNLGNVLGSGGKVATAYSRLVRKMRGADAYFCRTAPKHFMQMLSETHSQFSGGNQHDAMELFDSVTDILHEDLNRVLVKETTAPVEDRDRADDEVATETWANHLKRNNSIITDLFQGQFKSRLTCPNKNCAKRHVRNFDVFASIACPIPGPPPISRIVKNLRIYLLDDKNGGYQNPIQLVATKFVLQEFNSLKFMKEFAQRASDLSLNVQNLFVTYQKSLDDGQNYVQHHVLGPQCTSLSADEGNEMWTASDDDVVNGRNTPAGLRIYQFPNTIESTIARTQDAWCWVNVHMPSDSINLQKEYFSHHSSSYHQPYVRAYQRKHTAKDGDERRTRYHQPGKILVTFPMYPKVIEVIRDRFNNNHVVIDCNAFRNAIRAHLSNLIFVDKPQRSGLQPVNCSSDTISNNLKNSTNIDGGDSKRPRIDTAEKRDSPINEQDNTGTEDSTARSRERETQRQNVNNDTSSSVSSVDDPDADPFVIWVEYMDKQTNIDIANYDTIVKQTHLLSF